MAPTRSVPGCNSRAEHDGPARSPPLSPGSSCGAGAFTRATRELCGAPHSNGHLVHLRRVPAWGQWALMSPSPRRALGRGRRFPLASDALAGSSQGSPSAAPSRIRPCGQTARRAPSRVRTSGDSPNASLQPSSEGARTSLLQRRRALRVGTAPAGNADGKSPLPVPVELAFACLSPRRWWHGVTPGRCERAGPGRLVSDPGRRTSLLARRNGRFGLGRVVRRVGIGHRRVRW